LKLRHRRVFERLPKSEIWIAKHSRFHSNNLGACECPDPDFIDFACAALLMLVIFFVVFNRVLSAQLLFWKSPAYLYKVLAGP
jgi:hypothetical protein